MAARSQQIVRELLHKECAYLSCKSSTSHSINQSRNFHLNHQVCKPQLLSSSNVANTLHLQPPTLPTIVETSRTDSEFGQQFTSKTVQETNVDKLLLRSNANTPFSRFYSTAAPFYIQRRTMSKKKWGNQAEASCPDEKSHKKKGCPAQPCPKWVLRNCPPQKPQKGACDPFYVEPCCKKKLCPYPSYSETCAERLDDDPSECMQCPWSKCGGVENIKVPKRKYHTSTGFRATRSFTRAPPPEGKLAEIKVPINLRYQIAATSGKHKKWCDASKEPCRRPPGKCDDRKRRQEEACEKEKRDKKYECPPKPKKKKCSPNWPTAYRLWLSKGEVISDEMLMNSSRCTKKPGKRYKKKVNPDMVTPDDDCMTKLPFHRDGMSYEKTRKSKQIDDKQCKRKPRKKLPSCGPGACNQDCASRIDSGLFDQIGFIPSYELAKRPDCDPDLTRNKKDCPDSSNISDVLFAVNRMELAKAHDKGNPPPCPTWRKRSKKCPKKKPCKKPLRSQRDLKEPVYRKQREPWIEDDRGHGERPKDKYW